MGGSIVANGTSTTWIGVVLSVSLGRSSYGLNACNSAVLPITNM